MNKNVRYTDVKRADGIVTICLRFYAANNVDGDFADSIMIPVNVKALPMTPAEIKKMGGLSKLCRLNTTKWEVVGAPKIAQKYVKHLYGQSILAYYNGSEQAWKFANPDDDPNYVITAKVNDNIVDHLYDECEGICYEPHCDARGNYGNPKEHAVYDGRRAKGKNDTIKAKIAEDMKYIRSLARHDARLRAKAKA